MERLFVLSFGMLRRQGVAASPARVASAVFGYSVNVMPTRTPRLSGG